MPKNDPSRPITIGDSWSANPKSMPGGGSWRWPRKSKKKSQSAVPRIPFEYIDNELTFKFGEYKGRRLKDCTSLSYVEWMIENGAEVTPFFQKKLRKHREKLRTLEASTTEKERKGGEAQLSVQSRIFAESEYEEMVEEGRRLSKLGCNPRHRQTGKGEYQLSWSPVSEKRSL